MSEETPWFANWFDTKYYHILYQHRNDTEAARFMTNLVGFLGLSADSKVLDLACGKGRHARFLNELGLDVTGLDLSENSILAARAFENARLRFDVHDMREIYKEEYFDTIFNLFTSFGYFEDQKENLRMLRSVSAMLKPEGVLIIDFMNAQKVIDCLVASEQKTLGGIEFRITRKYDGQFIVKTIVFEAEGRPHNYTERVQALKKHDFTELLELAGFRLKHVFGNYDLEGFDANVSDRLILIAEKS